MLTLTTSVSVAAPAASEASAATSAASSAAAAAASVGDIHLDLLAADGLAVQRVGRLTGVVLVVEGDERVPLAGDVRVGDGAELFELALELGAGGVAGDPVDK